MLFQNKNQISNTFVAFMNAIEEKENNNKKTANYTVPVMTQE